ncbi:MAG: asparaginase [Synechococcales bacterium]|nr:asparaginase [Synechococcales bacterium]
MTLGRKTDTTALEVHLLREGIVESVHPVHATVCDERGRVLLVAGSAETETFVRSALKPFQALCVTATGALERFKLSDRDLAIICSSHHGSMDQIRQTFHVLWQADLDVSVLQCPIPVGGKSSLEYNCSGKHAGMLVAAKQMSVPLATYLRRNHPVQQLILGKVAEILKIPSEELIVARDDCGAPTYFMQLRQMAALYARLASGDNLDLERIVRAMVNYPDLISGEGNFDTELMRLTQGEIVSKAGAEGIQCIGRVKEGVGLAIKVLDGAKRAKYAVAIHLLKQMGWVSSAVVESLSDRFLMLGDFKRLEVQGELSLL